ncbi:sugar transferase [Salipiger bermudensis]|uniref:sugar transferase n=1 Tax=Salipiger bermudensis TaxID=344736 RepID=UPI0028F70F40|nr:sugar transferase [Salipiger bermudensis]
MIGLGSAARYNGVQKRVLDLVLSIIMLPALLPVIALLYIAVRLEGGPGFFGHRRVGRDGKTFRCWKIRTMVPDANARLAALLESDPEARAEWERDHKLRNDPRITRLGAFLRKSSLDELPQIWNVLKGEMSLIGPRPVTEPELERYGGQKWVYQSMRPGVTGLWQVSGRNDVSYEERVELDVSYYKELSMISDLRILFRTAGAVMNRTGC